MQHHAQHSPIALHEVAQPFGYRQPITMHCLKGAIDVTAHGSCKTMRTGDFMYLAGKVPHMLRATKDASVLVTIILQKLST